MSRRKWIDPQAFADLRKQCGYTRQQAADLLDVTRRTIQNWETGGARIPWMAFRLLRILRGYALPGPEWEGWTLYRGKLYDPAGRELSPEWLANVEAVFAQARLWRQMYAASGRAKSAQTVLPFPTRRGKGTNAGGYGAPAKALQFPGRPEALPDTRKRPYGPLKRTGGTR